jgi:phosphinothricin acetyltransferase
MVAVIGDPQRSASVAFHRALGFAEAGMLRAVGHKFGRDLDIALMQLPLGD